MIAALAANLLQLALLLLVSPLVTGCIRTLKARLQTRRGPGVLQPYQDLYKLLRKGMVIPDYNVDGGLQSANLAMPPVPGAPPGSMVLIRITIDENGNVTPNQILNDTSGFGSEVQKAARTWKFKPPTAKGKPVNTSISVRVTF